MQKYGCIKIVLRGHHSIGNQEFQCGMKKKVVWLASFNLSVETQPERLDLDNRIEVERNVAVKVYYLLEAYNRFSKRYLFRLSAMESDISEYKASIFDLIQ